MSALKIEKGKTFSKMTIKLDETSFINCVFDSCDVYYSGGPFDAVDCDWRNNHFYFKDAAWRTGAFFADMGWLKDNVPFAISYDENPTSN